MASVQHIESSQPTFIPPTIPPYQDYRAFIQGLAGGEEDALAGVLTTYGKPALALATRLVRDRHQADEVVNEALFRLYRRFTSGPIDEERLVRKGLLAYWLTIVHHTSVDELRKRNSRPLTTSLDMLNLEQLDLGVICEDPDDSPESKFEERERAGEIQAIIQKLPGSQRQAVFANFYAGLSHPETAEAFNIPLGTIKTRIRLGYQKLRPRLAHLR